MRITKATVRLLFIFLAVGLVAGPTPWARAAESKQVLSALPARVDFSRDIRPVISTKCFACHGPDAGARMAGLRLDRREEAIKERGGARAIVPGNPAASRVYQRISAREPARRMPPPGSGRSLAPSEIQLLKRWIAQGAPYAEHWAFRRPRRLPPPRVKDAAWVRNPIDAFILARLEGEGLKPSPEADRYTLIRRLSLDLIGLPPTPPEVEAFVHDSSPDAYEQLVDRLLTSPHYGERWARVWLDLARYADSAGYGSDPLRPNIWPYRDWVIGAFNRNLPYDQFTIEQIAGDLLPNPTQEQLIATAFHRNTMTNTEGGTDDEEFRVAAVKDRIATTAQVWMGLTMGCAQCHSHKFDPITQREYYQFFAYFNETADNDQPDESPTLPVPTPEQREKTDRLKGEIAALESRIDTPSPAFLADLASWERAQSRPIDWVPLDPVELQTAGGTTLTKLPDGSLLAEGKSPETESYTVRARAPLKGITALRVELLPDERLPKGGPGRASNGDLILSDVRVTVAPAHPKPVTARFVRVENTGVGRILSLAEVQVFSAGANVAPRGKASQSSTDYEGLAALAIDGNTNGDYFAAHSTTHTRTEDTPWWEVDLGADVPIDEIAVWNRTDGGLGTRLTDFRVLALAANRKTVWETKVAEPPSPSARLSCSGAQTVVLRNATSSFDAPGFEVGKAIDADAKGGWAIGDQAGQAQAAVFETATPVGDEAGATLTVTLAQSYGGQHTLGRFRLSATTAAPPVRELSHRIRAILAVAPEQRTEQQRNDLAAYFRPLAPSLAPVYQELAQKKKDLAAIKPVEVPVMRELAPEKRRVTHVMAKGNFLNPAETVEAALPAAFPHMPPDAPPNRLGVARWLISRENPLTARVAVNRFWAQLFGTGIVETEEDFGTQGALPSHPALLDWLAVDFMERGWDVKTLLKTIVMSATYRQSSKLTQALLAKDPRSRLLGRYPRRRLDAESVRDQALALSGLLSGKIGGPSVYPPQPDGLWRAAFNGERTWPTSTGEDRYRRGLYTFWRRTVPYPSMATFDAPSREICTMRRVPTNTPLQALVTLNDPAYVEMAQALGRRIVREGGATIPERARYALRLALVRPPQEEQVRALAALYQQELVRYRNEPEAAKKLATEPIGPLPEGMDAAEQAAWTVVANVLLNLDGVLAKG
jgi:hypothetical protein